MIRLVDVRKEYPRGVALDGVSFQLRKGELCFLTGHSGAGKSTIMRLIHMAERPTAGEVRVSGYSSDSIRPREIAMLRRKIGFVFQDFRLLQDRSAASNVAFALEVTGARQSVIRFKVNRLLTHVGLAAKSEALPAELSGGEQQRVAIARALAHDPLVLLADEPTGNLDERATHGVFELIREINTTGTAVLFATHNLDLVRRNPEIRVIEVDHGRVVFDSAGNGSE
ncbi:MAG: cell division ATP-binding protein FtsE [Gemmatimonadetes bacterium]|nr:cell division ATP-binding protein FtsE [Gemmatimonadota bacterium]